MSENRITYVPSLPTFADGVPLSATSLNAFTANQEYLNQRMSQPVPAVAVMAMDTDYYTLHLMRYLFVHIKPESVVFPSTVRVKVNGKRVVEESFSTGTTQWSGVVDLQGNDLDGAALGLTYNEKYPIRWEIVTGPEEEVRYGILWIAETPGSSGSLALPQTPPSFADGQILTAEKLNAIGSDIGYLIGVMDKAVNPGFQYSNTHIQAPSNVLVHKYRMKHAHRYLVIRAVLDMGFYVNALTFTAYWNGNEVYTTTRTKASEGGGVLENVTQYIDLSSYSPVVDTVYTVEINAQKDQYDDFTRLKMLWVGESPVNNLPAF